MSALELTGSRPPSAGPRPSSRTSNRPRSGYKVLADKSSVDELLFGSHHPRHEDEVTFKSPWSTPQRESKSDKERLFSKKPKMRPMLWAPDSRTSVTSHSDRKGFKGSTRSSNHHNDLDKYRPVKQTPSFCDETLFGHRLEEPSFEAPWAEKTKKVKPYLFSPVDYSKLTREQSTMSAKYSSTGTMDGRPPSRQGRRPVTATTRPVTVESSYDIAIKPTWKP
ncbi:RBPJ-interacting and tubulin-associated protein 1-like [Mya arenaria]|nr:RBPJ-interacting and tubulin-associated protein 1-like [Mya arenaria]